MTKSKTAASSKTASSGSASEKKKSSLPDMTYYNLLAFENGKARVQGSYAGRSPPQAAKKVLKQLKRKAGSDVPTIMFLRKVGSEKVSAYRGYNEVLAEPIYAYEIEVDDEANPGKKKISVKKTREILLDEKTKQPLVPKFTHTHSARVVRVAIYPGGL